MNLGSHVLNQRFFGNASIFRCDFSAVAQRAKNAREALDPGQQPGLPEEGFSPRRQVSLVAAFQAKKSIIVLNAISTLFPS